jgi:hypothetical protein
MDSFRPYLFSGERILWTGQPKRGVVLRPSDAFLIPFSLLWTGMVVWMFTQTLNSPNGTQPDVVLIIFLAFGIYATIGRFVHDAAIRSKLNYAVTDQRILVLRGSRSSKLTSLDVRHLPKLELTQYGDGTGTLAFESQNWFPGWGGTNALSLWVPSLNAGAQLFRIRDPRKVYELIRNEAHS